MGIKVSAADLRRAINVCQFTANGRTTMDILKHALVRCIGNKAAFFGTDIDTSVTYNIPCEGVCGDFLIPLVGVAGSLDQKSGDVLLMPGNNCIEIISGKSKFELPTPQAVEFPVRAATEENVCEIESGLLKRAIQCTEDACDTESTRYALGGVNFATRGGMLSLEATNGRTLCVFNTGVSVEKFSHIIPQKAIKSVRHAIDGGTVRVGISNNSVSFSTENCRVAATVAEGRFPDVTQIAPSKEGSIVSTFDRVSLVRACAQARFVTDDETRAMDLEMKNGVLSIKAASKDRGRFFTEIEAVSSSEGWQVKIDLAYLQKMIDPLSEQIEIGKQNDQAAMCVFDGAFVGLIAGMA